MDRRVSATYARVHFGEILRAVQEEGETVVVERGGQPTAVILPMAAYERLGGQTRSRHWQARLAALHGLWRGAPAESPLADAAELVREDREQRDRQLDEALRG